jgi:ribose-phosphate pyrophosphokinase
MKQETRSMKLISGNANLPLAQDIADYLDLSLTDVSIRRFADNEIFVQVNENVRGEDVFVIQSTSAPANDHLLELLIIIDALTRASAYRITAVIPYFGYARQDRKTGGRTPISAKLVANLISTAGADRVLTVDLHAGQIQGFFDVPTDNLIGAPEIAEDIRAHYKGEDLMVVSPDIGGVVRARELARRLGCDLAIVDKRRPKAGDSEVMNIIGEVEGRHCILVDDMADSGGTLVNAADALLAKKASGVSAHVTHGVLSADPAKDMTAVERVSGSKLRELVICDSIRPSEEAFASDKIRVLPLGNMLGEAIRRIANNESVSKLFE